MATPHGARVTEAAFLGVLWSGTGLSLCFLVFRLCVKFRSFRRFYSDDFLVIAAWAMMLANSILWQIYRPALYEFYAIQSGKKPFTSGFVDRYMPFLHNIVSFTVLFYTCIWTVKLSFLLFFRRLGSRVRGHTIWWWCVLVITVLTWVACVADIQYKCVLSSFIYVVAHCQTEHSTHYLNRTFYANCAADVITDCLIISIPVVMFWRVRIPLRQKLILIGVFSVTVVVMIISVIRVAVVNSNDKNVDISWLYLWSNVEMTTSVIIACVGSFRQLFINNQNKDPFGSPGKSTARRPFLSYFGSRGKTSSDSSGSHKKWPTLRHKNSSPSDSEVRIVPLGGIQVSNDIDISHTAAGKESVKSPYFNIA